ncbi:MAG: RadC family protein [Clostridia bacterium]|nr:RadC family protein [Clostridia bacterium]
MKNDKTKEENIHRGHRQRLKERVLKYGLRGLSVHERLEYLLTYVVPQKNTNPTAHNLINTFGSFDNVFNSTIAELTLVNGVGKEMALYITALKQFADILNESANKNGIVLNTTPECVNYFRANFKIAKTEEAYVILTDKSGKLLKVVKLNEGTTFEVGFDKAFLTSILATTKASNIILIHTHPHGKCDPSVEDIKATKQIIGICGLLGSSVNDHIIINQTEYYSFRLSNMLSELVLEMSKKLDFEKDKT